MKFLLLPTISALAFSAAIVMISGCDSSDKSDNNTTTSNTTAPTARFIELTMQNQDIVRDETTQLEWINGSQMMGIDHGCLPFMPGMSEMSVNANALNHCEGIMFGGHDDWRVPSIDEIQMFTVDMQSENMIPFYANPACPRMVGLSEMNLIETINTHNTTPIGEIHTWEESNAGIRCVREVKHDDNNTMHTDMNNSSDTTMSDNTMDTNSTQIENNSSTTSTSSMRFTPMTMMQQDVIQDSNTKLEWVNGSQVMGVEHGCARFLSGVMQSSANTQATEHCNNLEFAGHDDWKLPTAMQIQAFTVGMNDDGLTPFYAMPTCPRMVGSSGMMLNTVNTHNTTPIGEINMWANLNAGVRCVRAY